MNQPWRLNSPHADLVCVAATLFANASCEPDKVLISKLSNINQNVTNLPYKTLNLFRQGFNSRYVSGSLINFRIEKLTVRINIVLPKARNALNISSLDVVLLLIAHPSGSLAYLSILLQCILVFNQVKTRLEYSGFGCIHEIGRLRDRVLQTCLINLHQFQVALPVHSNQIL